MRSLLSHCTCKCAAASLGLTLRHRVRQTQQILDTTEHTHPDHQPLSDAHSRIAGIAAVVAGIKQRQESEQRIQTLQAHIDGLPEVRCLVHWSYVKYI